MTASAISEGAKSYLSGFCQLSRFSENSAKENVYAGLKIASYLLVIPVVVGLAVWGFSSCLAGRVRRDFNNPTREKVEEVVAVLSERDENLKAIEEANEILKGCDGLEGAALENFINPPITKITDHVYLGNQKNAQEVIKRTDEKNSIVNDYSIILTCSEVPMFDLAKDKIERRLGGFAIHHSGLKNIWAPLSDDGSDAAKAKFKETCASIIPILEDARKAGKKVLVHCNAGSSRSASVVIAYRIARGESFHQILREVVGKRNIVNIRNFQDVLLDEAFVNSLRALIALSDKYGEVRAD